MKRKGEDRPAIAIRFEDIPFALPFEKEKLTSKIRQINKKSEKDVGENNCAYQFRNGKAKAVLIYLDIFNTRIQDIMFNSESSLQYIHYDKSFYSILHSVTIIIIVVCISIQGNSLVITYVCKSKALNVLRIYQCEF